MAFEVDWDGMKDNLFDACKESVKQYIDEAKGDAKDFYDELRDFTDRVTDAKKELAMASGLKKKVKIQTLEHEMRSLGSMCARHKVIFITEAENTVKEMLAVVVRIVGKIALSMVIAVS